MKKLFVLITLFSIIISCGKRETMIDLEPLHVTSDTIDHLKIPSVVPAMRLKKDDAVNIQVPNGAKIPLAYEEIVDSYYFIPLETTNECLIGNIEKMEMDSSLIFVFDERNDAALCFSESGKFICRYGQKGRGPEEYIKLVDMCIDKTRKEVCLLDDHGQKLLFYDYSGKLLRIQPKYYYFNEIILTEDHYILFTGKSNNVDNLPIDYHELVVSDRSQIPLYMGFSYSEKSKNFRHFARHTLNTFNNKVYFHTLLSDTIWEISGDLCKAKFVLKYPDKKSLFTREEILEMNDDLYRKKTNNRIVFNGAFLCTKDFLTIRIVNKDGAVEQLIYSHASGKIKYGWLTSMGFESQSLGNLLLCSFDFVTNRNSFINVLQPYLVLDLVKSWEKNNRFQPKGKDLELLNSIKEEDNPILMVVKLKKF